MFERFFKALRKVILFRLFLIDLFPNCNISGSSANIILSASKFLGTENGGKAEIGVNPDGNKLKAEVGAPKGEAPPNLDPGEGLPGGIDPSDKNGRLGLIANKMAESTSVKIREVYTSLNNDDSSFESSDDVLELDEELDEDDELLEQ